MDVRFKRIIERTAKYIPLFFEKKKFDTKGSFATLGQFFSSFVTLLIIVYLFISLIFDNQFFTFGLMVLIILQILSELNFLTFAKKNYGIKMVIFSLFGIQVINLGILLGVLLFILRVLGVQKL